MLLQFLIANSRTAEIYVDVPEDTSLNSPDVIDEIAEEAINKAQHEIEWYPEDQITVLRTSLALEKDKKKIKESNEPVYILNLGSWI